MKVEYSKNDVKKVVHFKKCLLQNMKIKICFIMMSVSNSTLSIMYYQIISIHYFQLRIY